MSPTNYRLVVKGKLGARHASAFEGMTVSAHGGITELTGGILWIIRSVHRTHRTRRGTRRRDDGVTSILSSPRSEHLRLWPVRPSNCQFSSETLGATVVDALAVIMKVTTLTPRRTL